MIKELSELSEKMINGIKVIESSLPYEHNDYDKGLLVGEHDTLISILDALHITHPFHYLDSPD